MNSTVSTYEFELGQEDLVPIPAVPAAYQRITKTPKRPHRSQVDRWWRRGLEGIPLPSVKLAGRRYSSEGAIRWWIAATNAVQENLGTGSLVVSPLTSQQRGALRRAGLVEEE